MSSTASDKKDARRRGRGEVDLSKPIKTVTSTIRSAVASGSSQGLGKLETALNAIRTKMNGWESFVSTQRAEKQWTTTLSPPLMPGVYNTERFITRLEREYGRLQMNHQTLIRKVNRGPVTADIAIAVRECVLLMDQLEQLVREFVSHMLLDPSAKVVYGSGAHEFFYMKLRSPVLYAKGGSDKFDICPNDVQQGNLGNCGLMATLAAFANSKLGRAAIKKMLVSAPNGYKSAVGVKWNSSGMTVVGGNTFPTSRTKAGTMLPSFAGLGAEVGGDPREQHETWPMIIEKAFAKKYGGYAKLDNRDTAEYMRNFTGVTGIQNLESNPTKWFAKLFRAHLAQKPTVLITKPISEIQVAAKKTGLKNMYGDHAYAVMNVGAGRVRLYNPWRVGSDQFYRSLTDSEVRKFFRRVVIANLH